MGRSAHVFWAVSMTFYVVAQGAKEECVCVGESQCPNGVVEEESILNGGDVVEFNYGEGILQERFELCSSDEVCCKIPSHLKKQRKPTTPSPDKKGEDSEESKESSEESAELEDDPQLPMLAAGLRGCGIRRRPSPLKRVETKLDVRITSGAAVETFYGEVPWMVRLLADREFICGGVLISEDTVLTAAHCIKRIKERRISAEMGEWDTTAVSEILPPQRRKVSKIVVHPDYNPDNLKNDVALIFVSEKFKLTKVVDTVCTSSNIEDVNGTTCVAVGWGKTVLSDTANLQPILRKVHLPLMDHDTCEKRLRETRLGKKFKLHPGFVCAGGTDDGDTCEGDGGGPLYCSLKSTPDRFAVVGITAWGIECGAGNPAVFASVPQQDNWIYSTLSEYRQSRQ